MNTLRVIHTIFIFVLTTTISLAQHVTFKAEANRKTLAIGETLQVGFFIESDAMDYSIDKPMVHPEHKGLRLVGEQRSQNVQHINGKGFVQDGIILIFNPEREGKLQIGSAKIVIDGKTYTTKPIEVEVTKSSTTTLSRGANVNQPVFLQTNVSNTNPYVNEQVNLTVKMYARDLGLLNRKRNFRQGKLEGLSPKMITSRPETIKQEIVSGKQFFSEEVAKYNLFPQKAGRIEIDPFSMDILVSGIYGTEAYEIKSNPVVINAKALPEEGKPKNFSGAVGNFTLTTSLDKKELKANESANLKIQIAGKGNFNTVIVPEVKTPKNIESYTPKKTNDIKNYEDGMQGSVSNEIVMVPEYGGQYTIAPVEFTYFDPKKEKYITLRSDEKTINVDGVMADEAGASSNAVAFNGHNESTSDNPIIDSVSELANEVSGGNGKWFGILGTLALVGVLGFVFLKRKKEENNSEEVNIKQAKDSINQRFQPNSSPKVDKATEKTTLKVTDEAKKELLNKLETLQQNINAAEYKTFYQLQEDLLCQIGMKFSGTDLAHFSDYSVGEKLIQNGWNSALVEEWKLLLNKARQAKYSAMNVVDDDLTEIYLKTEKLAKQFLK